MHSPHYSLHDGLSAYAELMDLDLLRQLLWPGAALQLDGMSSLAKELERVNEPQGTNDGITLTRKGRVNP